MTNEEKFIAKSKMFRIHFQLSEDEIDLLLLGKNVVYKGVEAHDPELTLQLIEAYPFIYGLDHQKFQKMKRHIHYGMICQKQQKVN